MKKAYQILQLFALEMATASANNSFCVSRQLGNVMTKIRVDKRKKLRYSTTGIIKRNVKKRRPSNQR